MIQVRCCGLPMCLSPRAWAASHCLALVGDQVQQLTALGRSLLFSPGSLCSFEHCPVYKMLQCCHITVVLYSKSLGSPMHSPGVHGEAKHSEQANERGSSPTKCVNEK